MSIRLVAPTRADKEKALDFRKEFFDYGETVIDGSEMLDMIDDYNEWLTSVENNTNKMTVNPDWVLTNTYFALDENDRIVGIIDLRHELKGFLVDFGHTGYSVRPSERRKGYATVMLKMLKDIAKSYGLETLQLSVLKTNTPSVKTILKNGGQYQRSFIVENEEADVYFINL